MRLNTLVLSAFLLASFTRPALGNHSTGQSSGKPIPKPKRADFNRDIYYRNKLEFSYELGWLPYNVPLIFDVFLHSAYTTWPLKYTLVSNIASLRWQVDGIQLHPE